MKQSVDRIHKSSIPSAETEKRRRRVGLDNSLARLDESQGIRANEYNKVETHLGLSGQCWDMLETKYQGMARHVPEKAENAVQLVFILEKETK